MHEAGRLVEAEAVRALSFAELRALVRRELAFAAPGPVALDGAPLPAKFRLTPDGAVVAVRSKTKDTSDGGRGAGGGRASGVVLPADALPADGAVLVVRTLDPSLASLLPGLRGLVAETGSVLSHLAILAREFGVSTVVGVEDAVKRFPPGTRVVVDGSTGEVFAATSEEAAA
jgi:pyruvate,water dikinase